MKLTQVMKKKYMDSAGNKCPYCGSTDVGTAPQFNADDLHGWRDENCGDCGKEWTAVYTLTDIEEV